MRNEFGSDLKPISSSISSLILLSFHLIIYAQLSQMLVSFSSKSCVYLPIFGMDFYYFSFGFLTPLHIVPEWYFLCQYAMLKAVPNKNAGFIILLTSIFTFFLFSKILSNSIFPDFIFLLF